MAITTPRTSSSIEPGEAAPSRRAGLRALLADATTRKAIFSVGGQGLLSVTSFATAVVIGRSCSQAELGLYALAMSIVLTMRAVQGELVAAPYTVYRQHRQGEDLAVYSGSVIAHQLILCAVGMLGVFLLGLIFQFGWGPARLVPVLWVLVVVLPFLLFRCFARHYLFAQLRFDRSLALDAVSSAIQLGGLALLMMTHRLSVSSALLVLGLASLVSCVAWYASVARDIRFRWNALAAHWISNWGFARWALASQLIGCSTPYLMPWLLTASHGEAATGRFAVCTTLIGLSNMYVCGVGNLLTPKATQAYVRGGVDALRSVLSSALLAMVVPLGLIVLVVGLLGAWLPIWVFGDSYTGLGSICLILAVSALLNSVSVVAGNGLWALDLPRANLTGDITTLLATLPSALILIPSQGLWGAALAALFGTLAGTAARCLTLRACYHSRRIVQATT